MLKHCLLLQHYLGNDFFMQKSNYNWRLGESIAVRNFEISNYINYQYEQYPFTYLEYSIQSGR